MWLKLLIINSTVRSFFCILNFHFFVFFIFSLNSRCSPDPLSNCHVSSSLITVTSRLVWVILTFTCFVLILFSLSCIVFKGINKVFVLLFVEQLYLSYKLGSASTAMKKLVSGQRASILILRYCGERSTLEQTGN